MVRTLATALGVLAFAVGMAEARAVETSLRPMARSAATPVEAEVVSRALIAPQLQGAPVKSLRPTLRPAGIAPSFSGPGGTEAGFRRWLSDFRPRALARGIRPATFDAAFDDVRFDPEVVARDRNQSEFTKTIWDYLDSAASDTRIANGKAALAEHRALLERIEALYGVEKEIVTAIWGLESAYGTFKGSSPVIQSMASLAYDGRRGRFFEGELLAALRILQDGHTTPDRMKGSWAGAMGHTQFMPTSFQRLAVDHTGDGRRDIWGEDPADALASTANYLAQNGWQTGLPWGVEVTLPEGFDYTQANREIERLPSAWARLGVLDTSGQPVPDHGPASVLLPAGHKGAAFLVFRNFEVIERYNTADAYVIGVGHLADRIRGGPPIRGGWPLGDRALTYDERIELQTRLTAAGFDTRGIDARIGPLTIDAVRAYQRARGMVPDGYASPALLKSLR
jgi:membrane-bound lytic murein transglycosylase B